MATRGNHKITTEESLVEQDAPAREQIGTNARRRSPVEVVLDGLTSRRPR